MSDKGIKARLRRKEDARHLRGRGNFVGDMAMVGQLEAAFVRSPVPHARIRGVHKPEGLEDRVFAAEDLEGLEPIRAHSGLPGCKNTEQPCLAAGKVRFAGEPVVMCLADSRARAEDLAEEVVVDLDELDPIPDMMAGRRPDAPRVHDELDDNIILQTAFDSGNIEEMAAQAAVSVTRELHLNRQCMVPMEGRAVLAHWDDRADQLVVYLSTQVPHLARTGLAACLGLEQRRIRVIPPDVGGGFGHKCVLAPEEVLVCWAAMRTRRPVRWQEDRREHLSAAANAREHHYRVTAHADAQGKILALEAEVSVDAGAYAVYPFTAGLEAAMAGGNLPGPYTITAYRVKTYTVATNKPAITPYRGVARTGVCFAIERMVDTVAHELGLEPWEVRLANLVPAEAMPYTSVTKKCFDSGDYPESLRRMLELVDFQGVRARQQQGEPDGRLIGVGFATYTEQTAHGTSVFAAWGIPLVPGFEQAMVRLTPDGGLELRVGVQSHGQGMETTLAQIAHQVLGIDPERVSVVHGDTGLTPYSTGTYASRSMVMAGGAVTRACRVLAERIGRIGAHLLQCEPGEVEVRDAGVFGPSGDVPFSEIGRVWYMAPQDLPEDVDTGGVEATAGYRPDPDTGTFSYSANAAVVAVDPELGSVELLDYAVVEDCGTPVNPMVVEGQIYGGTAQGIGTALYEEVPFEDGQPLVSTFLDYLVPGTTEVPAIKYGHMETPSPHTEFGIKGMGEGGAIAPPAAIANAVTDALRAMGVEANEVPITPKRLLAAIQARADGEEAA